MTDHYSPDINPQSEQDDTAHQSLIAFLQQHKPTAPPCNPNFEQQLFAEISKYPQRSPLQIPWTWLVPAVLVAGLGLTWGFSRTQQYQTASNPRPVSTATISESEQVAIEQSLINSWSMNDEPTLTATNTSADGQLLHELAPLEYE